MSFWDDLWGQAKEAVDSGLDQFKAVGVPAIQAGIEQWAINTIQDQHKQTTGKLNEGLTNLSNQPSSAIGQAYQQVLTNTVLTQYGGHILAAVVVVGVAGYLLLKK